jgi:agmatinase
MSQQNTGEEQQWPIIRAQPRSFFKAPLCPDMDRLDAQVAFIGVPFDQGTFGRPGARFGPDALRDAPRAYSYSDILGRGEEAEGFFDIDSGGELLRGVTMADCGNITVVPSDITGNFDKLSQAVEKAIAQGALPVVVGGDHAITFPAVRGFSKFAPLNLVHFDAHLDYTHDVQGVFHTHGSPIRRCHELPFVNHITSVGIRTARRKPYQESQEDGNLVITTKRFRQLGSRSVVDLIPQGENLYITFDIDVMNPSEAPGTGTPEIGGLGYQEIRECLVELVSRDNLVGFDLVEVAPPYDSSEITVQLASQLIIDILAARFPSK